jgi:ferredoxin-NADP reductase
VETLPARRIVEGVSDRSVEFSSHHLARAGRNLFLIGTGTGVAPFLSLIRDPEVYGKFERVVVVHGCRHASELAYADFVTRDLPGDELVGESVPVKLIYYPLLSGLNFVDMVHGVDSTRIRAFGDDLGHERGTTPCGITIASFMIF